MLATVIASAMIAKLSPPAEFKMGVQAWTFNRFTTFQAIEMTAQTGGSYIELYPGQTLKPGEDTKTGPEMGDAKTKELQEQLDNYHVTAVAFGVTGISKDPAEARKLFQWAKGLHLIVINTESTDALDTIEMMVKEFDIKVGFHDHPRQPNNPKYKMWDPNYVLSLVKTRDRRIGSCADIGHWVRSGVRPLDALHILRGRIVGCHLKDLSEFSPAGHDVPYGTGVSDIAAILHEFRRQHFEGPASVEYEYHEDNNLAEVASCLGFVRGYLHGR